MVTKHEHDVMERVEEGAPLEGIKVQFFISAGRSGPTWSWSTRMPVTPNVGDAVAFPVGALGGEVCEDGHEFTVEHRRFNIRSDGFTLEGVDYLLKVDRTDEITWSEGCPFS